MEKKGLLNSTQSTQPIGAIAFPIVVTTVIVAAVITSIVIVTTSSSSNEIACSSCVGNCKLTNRGVELCQCQLGYYGTSCQKCPAGKFGSDGYSCSQCPVGKFSDALGLSECLTCPLGKSSFQVGQTMCNNCTAGKAGINCQNCDEGSFSNAGDPTCTLCDPGFFSNESGSMNCSQCELGTAAPLSGSTNCIDCLSINASNVCFQCPVGFIQDGMNLLHVWNVQQGQFPMVETQPLVICVIWDRL